MDTSLISNAIESENMTPTDRLKIAIVGPKNGGKSNLAVTAPKIGPRGEQGLFVADFDDRKESIANKKDVIIKTYFDSQPNIPQAYSNFQIDIGKLEYAWQNKQFDKLPATIVLDSMTYMARSAMRSVLSTSGITGVKKLTIGGFSTNIARGYEPYDAEVSMLEGVISRIIGMNVNLICVFHERPEEAPDSTDENPKFTGKVTIHPPRLLRLLPLFNETWRILPDAMGVRQVQVQPNYEFVGGTCMKLDPKEEPDIMKMITKHHSRIIPQPVAVKTA